MNDSSEHDRADVNPLSAKRGKLRAAGRFGGRAVASIGDQGCTAATNFLTSLFIGRMLGPEILGIYAMTDVIVRVLRALTLSSMIEPLSIYAPRRSGDERGAYLAFLVISQLTLLGGLTILLALLSMLWAAAGRLDWSVVPAVVAALFYANLILFQALLRRQFYIEGQPTKALLQSISNLLLVILGFLAFWYWGGADLVSIYIMLAFAGIIVCVVQGWRLFHRLRRPTRQQRRSFGRETWRYARWNVLSAPIHQMSISGVILLAGIMLPIEGAGYLKVGETILAPFLQVVVGLNLLMLPMVSKRLDTMSLPQKRRQIVRLSLATLAVAVPYAAAMILLGPWLIRTGFGPDLMSAVPLLPIFAAIPIFDSLKNQPAVFLSAEGRSDLKLIVECVRAVLTLAVGIPLIWGFGVTGAAWARAIAAGAGALMSWSCVLWLWRQQSRQQSRPTA